MSSPVISFVSFIYQRIGDFGLLFFLVIIVVNLVGIWRVLPKRVQSQKEVEPANGRTLQLILNIHRIFILLISGMFSLSIVLAPEPALWLKILSSTLFAFIFMSFVFIIWLLVGKKPQLS